MYNIRNIVEDYPINLLDAVESFDGVNGPIGKWEHPLPSDLIPSVEYAVALLSERETQIIHMRYRNGMTYEEIAKIEGVTRERIKQVHNKAIIKLRHPSRIKWLIDGVQGSIIKERLDAYNENINERLGFAIEHLIKISDNLADITGNRVFENAVEEYTRISMEPNTPINMLGLSVRSYNALSRSGIRTICELLNTSTDALIHIKNLGKHSYQEILSLVHARGLEFINERTQDVINVSTAENE